MTATSNCPPTQRITNKALWGEDNKLERVQHTQNIWGNGSCTLPPSRQCMKHHFPYVPLSELSWGSCWEFGLLLASPSLLLCYLSVAKAAGLSTTVVSHHFKHTRFMKFNKFCYNSCRLKRDFLMGDTRLNGCPFVPFAASAVGHSELLACFLKHCSLCSLDRVFLVHRA